VDEFAAVTLRDEVDAFGRAARVNDLMRLGRVDEPLNPDARVFVFARRQLAQIMHAAMDVGVLRGVVVIDRVDHGLRLLRGRGAVQIDQRASVYLLSEDRKIFADLVDVESICQRLLRVNFFKRGLHLSTHPPRFGKLWCSLSRITRSKYSRADFNLILLITSSAKP